MKDIFLIGEIGINHNGSLEITKKLINNAKKANFHAVKFQKRTLKNVYSKEQLETPRESPWGKTTYDQKKGLEFEKTEYDEIDKYCKNIGIEWFASAWDLESLSFLDQYKFKYNKIASAMIVDSVFLREVANKGKYTYISTGMSEEKDIDNAVKIFTENNCPFELMHCVSTYPTKIHDNNLLAMISLKEKYNCKVGFSSHENGIVVSICAAVLGASSIERHITLDRTMYGTDQSASLEFSGMLELTNFISKTKDCFGSKKIGQVTEDEKKVALKLRSHLKINE